ncbi:MAG TPA: M1 family peptidase, partial [Gillisia sp.]|nr:M1 family peptidase [Gillisia sp.]
NQETIIGDYGVNSEGSGDMYYKGANLLNTLRSIYNDDILWWKTLKDYTETYKHQIINTKTVETFFDQAIDLDLQPIFDQYLRHSNLPELQLKKKKDGIWYRWETDVKNFKMPVDVFILEKETRLPATNNWQKILQPIKEAEDIKLNDFKFYIATKIEK